MSTVQPHIEYCASAWSPWTAADINCIEQVQIRAVKMVSGLKGKNYAEKLAELGLQTLRERRQRTDMIQTFKIINGFDRVPYSTWFTPINQVRTTRLTADPKNLEPQFARTETRKNFFSVWVPDAWNSLPSNVKESRNVHVFKKRYDSIMCRGAAG